MKTTRANAGVRDQFSREFLVSAISNIEIPQSQIDPNTTVAQTEGQAKRLLGASDSDKAVHDCKAITRQIFQKVQELQVITPPEEGVDPLVAKALLDLQKILDSLSRPVSDTPK